MKKCLPAFWIFFLLALPVVQVQSSIPTVEGLLRNGSNPDPSGEIILIKALIERDRQKGEEHKREGDATGDTALSPLHVKFIFSLEVENRVQMIQALYNKGRMDVKDLSHVRYFPWFERSIARAFSPEQSIFYSLLNILGLNRSAAMINSLKRMDLNVQGNQEIFNHEKLALFNEYKKYLMAVKDNKELKNTLANPLYPQEEEDRERVAKVMNSSFFKEQETVSLKRESGGYFWLVEDRGFWAKFENETHRLKQMKLRGTKGEVVINVGEYLLFNGLHLLPKIVFFKTLDGITYKIRFTSLSHFTPRGKHKKKIRKRFLEYQKELVKNRQGESIQSQISLLRPSFISY